MTEPPSPAVGQVWRGVEHGSLLKILLVHDGEVTYQVLHLGNEQLADTMPVGKILTMPAERWDSGYLEYWPQWNEEAP